MKLTRYKSDFKLFSLAGNAGRAEGRLPESFEHLPPFTIYKWCNLY